MTCKDCVHWDICDIPIITEGRHDASNCGKFKNKADFMEVEKYNELRENFIDFVCSGVNNPAPYCKNRCGECVNEREWCKYGDSCKGFNPDGERK